MKKKTLILPIILLLTLIMSACGVKKVPVSSIISGEIQNQSGRGFEVSYSDEETRAMSNYMMEGRFLHNGKTLYGSRHDETGTPYLCRMKFTAGEKGMYVRETEPVRNHTDAKYLNLSGEYLYYLQTDCLTGETAISRVLAAAGSTAEPEILYSGPCDFLSIRGGRLYFTDASNHLLSIAPDGSDLQTVLSDKEIYYPWFLSDDLLLFQDDADGESLHMRYFPTGFELRIISGRVCCFVVRNSELWIARAEDSGSEKCRLCRLDLNEFLSGFDPTARPDVSFRFTIEESTEAIGPLFSVNGSHINASNYRMAELDNWRSLSDDAWRNGFRAACQYVSKDFEIFYDYNEEGLITDMLFYEPSVKRSGFIEIYRYS